MADGLPANVVEISDDDVFDAEMAKHKSDATLIAVFSASWCQPCRQVKPVWLKAAAENPGVTFFYADFDECLDTADAVGFKSIPAFVHFAAGERKEVFVGAKPEAVEAFLKRALPQ